MKKSALTRKGFRYQLCFRISFGKTLVSRNQITVITSLLSTVFQDKYHYSRIYAGYVAGSTYDIALISPLFGFMTDKVGYRGLWVLAAPVILVCGYLFLVTIPGFPPLLFCLMMGISYTLVAAIAWSCAPFLVPSSGVGTSMGLLTCFQMFGVGISNALIGVLLSQNGKDQLSLWVDVIWFLGACACLGLAFAVAFTVLDWRTGSRLRFTQAEREKLRLQDNAESESTDKDLLIESDSLSSDSDVIS